MNFLSLVTLAGFAGCGVSCIAFSSSCFAFLSLRTCCSTFADSSPASAFSSTSSSIASISDKSVSFSDNTSARTAIGSPPPSGITSTIPSARIADTLPLTPRNCSTSMPTSRSDCSTASLSPRDSSLLSMPSCLAFSGSPATSSESTVASVGFFGPLIAPNAVN